MCINHRDNLRAASSSIKLSKNRPDVTLNFLIPQKNIKYFQNNVQWNSKGIAWPSQV